MKKIVLLYTLALLCYTFTSAQNEASNWYFGNNAGINFNANTGNVTPLYDGKLSTEEGCTSISDSNGNLLFYTNGVFVYNKNHNTMPNGIGLKGNQSSTQSAIIVPKPGSDTIYYIFTVDTNHQNNPDEGFHYSEVDMSLNNGLGDVTSVKNVKLLSNTTEKLSAVLQDCESEALWVITFADANGIGNNNSTFYAYEVTNSGVSHTPVVSNLPLYIRERRGYLKFSPDGSKIACANIGEGLYLFDFDTTTGIVSNQTQISINFNSPLGQPLYPYGLEFSPNSKRLYVSTYLEDLNATDPVLPEDQFGALLQYDLNAANISTSEVVIDSRQTFRSALQLGPDGKIYRSSSRTYNLGDTFLSTINNPNAAGLECNYEHASIYLGGKLSRQGLPPFVTSFFNEKIDIINDPTSSSVNLPLCTGDTYTLKADNIPGATYTWTQDGDPIPAPAIPYEFVVVEPGNYEVVIKLNSEDCGTLEGQAIVSYFEPPVANQPDDIIVCDDNNNEHWAFDFAQQTPHVLGSQDPSAYRVYYYASEEDAINNENQITGRYDNLSNPQEIFVRVHHSKNSNCYDIKSFSTRIFDSPTINTLNDVELCDDDNNPTDGFTTLTLSSYNSGILGDQDPTKFTISYHLSQEDANTNSNPQPLNFTNPSAFNETIFARIENNNYTGCFSTAAFNITLNPIPEANNTSLIQCDEEHTPPGQTLFNLNQASEAITGAATNTSVSFFLSSNDALNNNNEITAEAFYNTQNPQTIHTVVTNTVTGCKSYSQLTLEVSLTASNNAQLELCDDDGAEDGFQTFTLTDANSQILNGAVNALNVSYYETYENALVEASPLGDTFINTQAYSQTIYARVENKNACYGINEILLSVYKLPDIETESEAYYCLNFSPEPLTLSSGIPYSPSTNYTYSWSTGDQTPEILINTPGTYTVRVSTANGCYKDKTITVLASNIATISTIDVVDASEDNNITILVSGEGNYEYALDFMDGPFQDSNTFENVPPGIRTVYVRDKNGCGTTEDLISVIGFPKYFTPNNDGINEYWQVYGLSTQFQSQSIIYIFDRYGKLLKELDPLSPGWDGSFKGTPMPTNDYWFAVTLEDGRVFKGHFTLKR